MIDPTELPTKGLTRLFRLEFYTWRNIRRRCLNEHDPWFPSYGGRGIKICRRWQKSFRSFLIDMGRKPAPGYSIERKDNDGDYCPENCVWATGKQQQQNTRRNRLIEFNGESLCVTEWARRFDLHPMVIKSRLELGWTIKEALTTRPWKRHRSKFTATIGGKTQSIRKWAYELGVRIALVYGRIYRGWSPEDALTKPRKYNFKD